MRIRIMALIKIINEICIEICYANTMKCCNG